jgi:hypothetical protein
MGGHGRGRIRFFKKVSEEISSLPSFAERYPRFEGPNAESLLQQKAPLGLKSTADLRKASSVVISSILY